MAKGARIQFLSKTGNLSGFAALIVRFPITRVPAGYRPVAALNWHEEEQREE